MKWTPVDIPNGWDPRAKQQPTGLIAYGATHRRPVLVPLDTPPKKKIRRCKQLECGTPVDVPNGWDPRTNKQPTGLFVALPAAVPCFSSPTGHPHKKSPLLKTADFLVGCPVGLEPTVSRSTIWRVNRLRYGHHINAPEGTRTPGPLLRRQLLYPPELRAHVVIPLGSFMAAVVCRHTLREV